MATVDGSRPLLSAGAGYTAGDWASVGAEASLDLLATASLNRGIDLGLGVEALANLEGSIRQYIAGDINAQAHAAARVRAQVQIPLDLFAESGFAVRLQAVAEAAAGVQLAIGLSVGDFLALAAQDERMQGAPLELLKVFLDEFTIQGGIMGKIAAAAMAYANLVAVGSLVPKGQTKPGFLVAAELGAGLEGGGGVRVFARFGVDDPRRLIRRSVDVAVSETLKAIAPSLPADSRGLLDEFAVALRIGLRSAFEIGEALAAHPGSAGGLALRAVQVAMEELQRWVFESAIAFASQQLRAALASLGFNGADWDAALPQRLALIARLRALPEEPFEATDPNRQYWSGVVADALDLAGVLQGGSAAAEAIFEPLAITWCSVQLMMKSVERISVAQARAAVVGAPTVGATQAFSGSLPAAPAALRDHVNLILNRPSGAALDQPTAVSYLVSRLGYRIELILPGSAGLLGQLTGKGNLEEALSVALANIGAFASGADGRPDAEASLAVFRAGLSAYINQRLETELAPLIEQAAAGQAHVRIYLDEVLVGTLKTMTGTVLRELESASAGSSLERALREMCSALLMRLFGRSLVVTADVLLAAALDGLQAQFADWARHANDPGGAVPVLVGLTGLDRDTVNDLVVETLEVCAQTFAPLPAARRAHMRDLLYQMIDTMPPEAGADALEALKSAGMVGNAEAALELAQLLGEEIAANLLRFIQALLTHAAEALLESLQETIAEIQRAVEAWVADLQALARELYAALDRLRDEIARLEAQIDDVVDAIAAQLSTLLGGFAGHAGSRSAVRNRIKDAFTSRALEALADVPGYGLLPRHVRRGIRSTVRSLVNGGLDNDVFDLVVDALQQVSEETADLLDDVRAIEPGDDLAAAIADLALDRIEAGVRAAFGGRPHIRVAFDAPIIGRIDLGRIDIPTGAFITTLRAAIRDLGRFDDALEQAAAALGNLIDLEADLAAAAQERDVSQALKDEADDLVAESESTAADLQIIAPQPGAAVGSALTVRLRLTGASEAVLSSAGLAQRRLYLWVNGREVDATRMRLVASAGAPAAVPLLPVRFNGRVTSFSAQPALPAATARLMHTGREKNGPAAEDASRLDPPVVPAGRLPAVPSGPLGSGGLFESGRPVVPVESFGGAPAGGLPDEPPGIEVEVDVPASLLHQGVNSLACAFVPGPRQRRVERALSLLVTAPRKPRRGRPAMPEALPALALSQDLAAVLQRRGVKAAVTAKRCPAFKKLEHGARTLSPRLQKQAVEDGRQAIADRLDGGALRLQEMRRGAAEGRLRPRKAPPQGRQLLIESTDEFSEEAR